MHDLFTGKGSIRRLICDLLGAVTVFAIIPAAYVLFAIFN